MKLTYLGTAAAEGWPATFCRCRVCQEARRLGGKNIRTRSQALLNDDLLLDLCPDTYAHTLQQNVDFSGIKYLLVTHSHTDHFYPAELVVRGGGYGQEMATPILDIYCNTHVRNYFYTAAGHELEKDIEAGLRIHILKEFETVEIGPYRVTPLPARHMAPGWDAWIYLIEQDGKRLLYAHDTGRFFPEVFGYLEKLGKPLDLISLDCTSGKYENGPQGGHMGLPDNAAVKAELLDRGIADGNTKFICNHFSHNGHLLFDELEAEAKKHGLTPSYDGMKVEF